MRKFLLTLALSLLIAHPALARRFQQPDCFGKRFPLALPVLVVDFDGHPPSLP